MLQTFTFAFYLIENKNIYFFRFHNMFGCLWVNYQFCLLREAYICATIFKSVWEKLEFIILK